MHLTNDRVNFRNSFLGKLHLMQFQKVFNVKGFGVLSGITETGPAGS